MNIGEAPEYPAVILAWGTKVDGLEVGCAFKLDKMSTDAMRAIAPQISQDIHLQVDGARETK